MSDPQSSLNAAEEELEIDLRQILAVLKKWHRMIITLTILSGLVAALVSHYLMTPIYQADTLLRFSQATDKLQTNPNAAANTGSELDSYVKPVLTMNTHLAQIKSRELMQRIIDELHLPGYSPNTLAGMIDASIVKDSNLISVKVDSAYPFLASSIANTLSEQYLQLMNEKTQEQINSSVTFLTSQKQLTDQQLVTAQAALKKMPAKPTGAALADKEDLQREIDRLKQTSATLNEQIANTLIAKSVDMGDSSMVIMSAAAVPTAPFKPNLVQNVLIAMVLGLMLFTLLAFILEYLDNTVKTPDDFKDMQLSVLGVIPQGTERANWQAPIGRLDHGK